MSRIAEVLGFERVTREGVEEDLVTCDAGDGDASTVQLFGPAGDDSPPLPGDFVQLVESGAGDGTESAIGYADDSEKEALPGERRLVARNLAHEVVAKIWLKRDGTVIVTNVGGKSFEMSPDGNITVKGDLLVEGNISAHGEVSANVLVPEAAIGLSSHIHTAPSGGGPTSAPTPPTPAP